MIRRVALTTLLLALTACGRDESRSQALEIESPTPSSAPDPQSTAPTTAPVALDTAAPVALAPVASVEVVDSAAPPPVSQTTEAPQEQVTQAVVDALAREIETLQARIDRFERAEQELRQRLDALDVQVRAINEHPAPRATPVIRPKSAPPPKPVELQRRSAPTEAPLPFLVESVDTWAGEKRIVVRDGARLKDLKPGDLYNGWRVESAEGQTVTVVAPDGSRKQVASGWRSSK